MFFSSDVANPDTNRKFYADMEMVTTTLTQPDPGMLLRQFLSSEIAGKANKWQGRNTSRWRNADYDKLCDQSTNELDPVKRAALLIAMNDICLLYTSRCV